VVSAGEITEAAGMQVTLAGVDLSAPVAADATEVPCLVEGQLTVEDGSAADIDLVVAINGTIEAVGKSAPARVRRPGVPPDRAVSFSIPLPATAFRDGPNTVELFVPERADGAVRLARVPRA
jgi:hypothetical protein